MKWEASVLYARVAAPPVNGAANKALIELLSDTLRVPKSRIAFESGESSREKSLRVEGMNAETLRERIESALRP